MRKAFHTKRMAHVTIQRIATEKIFWIPGWERARVEKMKGGCSHIAERGLTRGNEKPMKDLSQRPESSGTCFKETTLALMEHMFSGPF